MIPFPIQKFIVSPSSPNQQIDHGCSSSPESGHSAVNQSDCSNAHSLSDRLHVETLASTGLVLPFDWSFYHRGSESGRS
jgi:hypothetical protein